MDVPRFVLIAEEDPEDRIIYKEVFAQTDFEFDYEFVKSRSELFDFLKDETKPRPCLIILGLFPPDNLVASEELMSEEGTRSIPVIIITSEEERTTARKAYANCANSFFIKPMGFRPFVEAMNLIFKYWFDTAVAC